MLSFPFSVLLSAWPDFGTGPLLAETMITEAVAVPVTWELGSPKPCSPPATLTAEWP